MVVGYLHPGEMGAALAGSSPGGLWLADGRSDATAARAASTGLDDAGTLEALVERADVVVSVCPPGAALEVADAVATAGFGGIYADLNATSPETARSIDARFDRFVDGGIIGPPPRVPGTTRLYLAGPEETASTVAAIWQGSALDVRWVSSRVGAASAIKACYAA